MPSNVTSTLDDGNRWTVPAKTAKYTHPDPANTNETALAKHSGEKVEILRGLHVPSESEEEVGPMFRIKFSSGLATDAFIDELSDWS